MDILFIAPIPPPIDGQSKASKVILDGFHDNSFNVKIININKRKITNGIFSFSRFNELFRSFKLVSNNRKGNDIIFISLAESFLGNLRDIMYYMICYKDIDKVYIQMLGGAGMKKILTKNTLRYKINKHFIKKMAGVIVEGPLNYETFSQVIDKGKIHIVPNFAEDYLFVSDEEIDKKFGKTDVLQIVYLSNLIKGKGYDELADAYIKLDEQSKKKIRIVYVGGFEDEESSRNFLKKIEPFKNISYIGRFIDGQDKRALFCKSHVFCLPTYYPFEGQPISILEAYATGCAVITTDHSGIPFIFSDIINGYKAEKQSVDSLVEILKKLPTSVDELKKIAIFNRDTALVKYRTSKYQKSVIDVLKKSILDKKNN